MGSAPRVHHRPYYSGNSGDYTYQCSCGESGWTSIQGNAIGFVRKHKAKNKRR